MASQPNRPTRRAIVSEGVPKVALILAWAALLGFFARSMVDFRYVYPDQIPDTASNVVAIVIYTAILGGWIAALGAFAAGFRWGAVACLLFTVLPILLGVTTVAVFCPMPCTTAAPAGDVLNLLCLGLGLLSALALLASLRTWRSKPAAAEAASGS
jgi:hypothetical protein